MAKIQNLFDDNQFWDNTMKKLSLATHPMGSILKKRNLVLVNLTLVHDDAQYLGIPFENIYAYTIAHEIAHLFCMDIRLEETPGEEELIQTLVPFVPLGDDS